MELYEFVNRMLCGGPHGGPVPFVEKGRDYDGVDCWGVIYLAFRDVYGIQLPSYVESYTERDLVGTSALARLVSVESRCWSPIWTRGMGIPNHPYDRRPGDVAVFLRQNRPVHTALVIDRRRVLHSEEELGTFVDRIDSPIWQHRLEGIYRYRHA